MSYLFPILVSSGSESCSEEAAASFDDRAAVNAAGSPRAVKLEQMTFAGGFNEFDVDDADLFIPQQYLDESEGEECDEACFQFEADDSDLVVEGESDGEGPPGLVPSESDSDEDGESIRPVFPQDLSFSPDPSLSPDGPQAALSNECFGTYLQQFKFARASSALRCPRIDCGGYMVERVARNHSKLKGTGFWTCSKKDCPEKVFQDRNADRHGDSSISSPPLAEGDISKGLFVCLVFFFFAASSLPGSRFVVLFPFF